METLQLPLRKIKTMGSRLPSVLPTVLQMQFLEAVDLLREATVMFPRLQQITVWVIFMVRRLRALAVEETPLTRYLGPVKRPDTRCLLSDGLAVPETLPRTTLLVATLVDRMASTLWQQGKRQLLFWRNIRLTVSRTLLRLVQGVRQD